MTQELEPLPVRAYRKGAERVPDGGAQRERGPIERELAGRDLREVE